MEPGDDPAYYEALGRAIKVLRTERGMDRRGLAAESGVSYPYLSEIENGKKRPSSRALLQIANALGVPPSTLLEATEAYVVTMREEEPPTLARMLEPPPPAAETFAPLAASPAPTPPPPARRRWFHSTSGPDPDRSPAGGTDPRTDLIRELLDLSAEMREDDLARLVDLARRLRG